MLLRNLIMIRRVFKLARSLSVVRTSAGPSSEVQLTQWVKQNGAEVDSVRIDRSPVSGCGVFSTRDFIKGDVVMSLPMNLTVMVYPDDEENSIQVEDSDLPDTVIRLAIKLLRLVKQKSSLVSAYVDALPQHLPNPSLMFKSVSEDDIYRQEVQRVVRYYENTVDFLKSLRLTSTTEDDIRWSLAVIQSRSFGNGMGHEILIPFIDMMNHGDLDTNELFIEHPLANVTYGWYQSGSGTGPDSWTMFIKARNTILEGEELFVSYGDHSNEYFLLYYGFVPLYNPRDEFVLFQNLDEILSWYFDRKPGARGNISDEQLEVLKEQIKITGQMAKVVKFNLCADGSMSPIMIEFFKMLCHGSESEAQQWILKACQERLENTTSLQHDLRLLSQSTHDPNNVFKYQYEELKEDDDEGGNAKKTPLYGSDSWWVLVHSALKKLMLHDVM